MTARRTWTRAAIGLALALAALESGALQRTTASPHDARIRYVDYRADDVVPVNAAPGRVSVITFAEGENVVNYGSGFIAAWDFAAQGRHFFLKPREEDGTTNLFVTTNLRTYSFDLRYRKGAGEATYRVVFRYPEEERRRKAEAEKREEQARRLSAQPVDAGVPSPRERASGAASGEPSPAYNWNYTMNFGEDPASAAIAPEAVYDDGLFTVIRFPPGADMPAVYQVTGSDPVTGEALLKTHVDPENGALIVEKVVREMRLRLRDAVVGLYNEGYGRLVRDPFAPGTSVKGLRRAFAAEAAEPGDAEWKGSSQKATDGEVRHE